VGQFDGIVPTKVNGSAAPDPDFYFRLHWFPSAFAWECPNCPAAIQDASGLSALAGTIRGPFGTFDPAALMRQIAHDNGLSDTHWDCEGGEGEDGQACPHPFFGVWNNDMFPFTLSPGFNDFMCYILTLVIGAHILVHEVLIRFKPGWMRCRCLVLKRWCPHPKGTDAELAQIDEHGWDRLRLWYFALLVVALGLCVFQDMVFPAFFARHVSYLEKQMPMHRKMNVQIGGKFRFLLWSALVMAVLALLMMAAKWRVTRRKAAWEGYERLDALQHGRVESGWLDDEDEDEDREHQE